ncbi:MAG: hypothetical protein ACYDC5_13990 [Candidatus Dormibacteria bacterium]
MYRSSVLGVMVASPSDVRDERTLIRGAIHEWNAHDARPNHVVLLPVMWETHSWPEAGDRPQKILNRQLADDSDILIAIFWTRLGTPTQDASSGTAEEVAAFQKAGKPVLLYFLKTPVVLSSVDHKQVRALEVYRRRMSQQSYYFEVDSPDELKSMVRDHLSHLVRRMVESGKVPRSPESERDRLPEAPNVPTENDAARIEGSAGQRPEGALSPYQRRLAGWVAAWRTTLDAIEGDFNVASRHGLMNEVYLVILDIIRSLAALDDDLSVLDRLRRITVDAGQLRGMQVYLDGGVSFARLSEGCHAVIAALDVIAQDVWQ